MLGDSQPAWRDTDAFQPFNISTRNDDDLDTLLPGRYAFGDSFNARSQRWRLLLQVATAVVAVVALILAAASLSTNRSPVREDREVTSAASWQNVNRLAFGSCTSYDLRTQPIWDSIIATQPDGWIWLGDMAYLDTALVDCAQVPAHPQCNCSKGVTTPPYFTSCLPIDLPYSQFRLQHQVQEPGYQRLLSYLCPGRTPGGPPPQGSDPAACPRGPLLGVYDDHDFGNNNADGRNPQKVALKQLYLDAIGEPAGSPRRSAVSGLQAAYTLNQGQAGREVQVVLLDERWNRDAPPCSEAQLQCHAALQDPSDVHHTRCQDLLVSGGLSGLGSCCHKDAHWGQFCRDAQGSTAAGLPREAVCDPASELYGSVRAVLSADNASAVVDSEGLWEQGQAGNWQHMLEADSPMCEVLGPSQRQWLKAQLASSSAPLRIIASSSVLAGSLGYSTEEETCSGDDWECYPSAQLNLLHTVANVSRGCVVLLVGDYHYADIKVIQPGGQQRYAEQLQTQRLAKPVYQVMSSGMTSSTAHHSDAACEGSFREDLVGLRPLGSCAYMAQPNFALLEVDWQQGVVSLSVRREEGGGVAAGHDGSRQEVRFSLGNCSLIK